MPPLRLVALLGCCLLAQLVAPGSARALKAGTSDCPAAVAAALKGAETDADGDLIIWGTKLEYASGTIRAYTKFNASDPCSSGPAAVGVEVSDSTLDNLPGPDKVSAQPPAECAQNPTAAGCFSPFDVMWLKFSEQDLGDFTPFQELELDWNPMGHMPPGVYNTPHFDFHFYLVPKDEVMNISAGPCHELSPEAFYLANEPIPAACFPGDNYTNLAASAPYMGNHMLSTLAPEIVASMTGMNAIGAWNETFIWGTYSRQVTFMEPMIKLSYLLSKPDECKTVPGMPQGFAIGGYKPQTYCITSSDSAVRVEMKDFAMFEAGCGDEEDVAPASFPLLDPSGPPLPAECLLPEY